MNFLEHQNARIEAGEYIRDRARRALWTCAREDAVLYFRERVAEAKRTYIALLAERVSATGCILSFWKFFLSTPPPLPAPRSLSSRSHPVLVPNLFHRLHKRRPTWPRLRRQPARLPSA